MAQVLQTQIFIDYPLLMRLRDGDEKAFSDVFQAYHHYLYVIACRYLMSESSAEDAVQNTFMRLWELKSTLDFSKDIKNLLFTILKNDILNEIRHNNLAIQKNFEMAQLLDGAESDFLRDLENSELRSRLYQLINSLAPQKREVCLLKIQQGMSNQEVADMMGISVPTVKSHYTQAIKFLRSRMNKMLLFILAWLGFIDF